MAIQVEKYSQDKFVQTSIVMREAFNSIGQDWSKEESERYVQSKENSSLFIIAKDNEGVLGFIVAEVKEDHLFLDAIGVLPNKRRMGIGKLLWNYCLDFAKKESLKEIKMIADPKSQAFLWYSKLGFDETGWVELSLKV